MTTQLKADFMLLLVTLFWGVSYWLIDISLTIVDPFTLNALRFLIAFFIALIFTYGRLKNVNKITLKYSAILGGVLVVVYIGATFGVRYTSLSNAGFLNALTVIITPVIGFLVLKQKQSKKLILTVTMCIVGIALLTLNEELKPALGDIFSLLCAFSYAVHLLITESAVKKEGVNAFQLGVFQLGFTGLLNLIFAFIVETPRLPSDTKTWTSVLFLSIFCTGIAYIVQVIAQQYTSATHVGVVFALEPVFAGLVAYFLAGEILASRAYVGAVLLVSSIFIMELDLKRIVTYLKRIATYLKKIEAYYKR